MNAPQQTQGVKHLHVEVQRLDAVRAEMYSPEWRVNIATTSQQSVGAPTPTLALLGSLAACTISGIGRAAQEKGLQIDDVKVAVDATRVPPPQPHFQDIKVHITMFSPENEARLTPILEALRSNGTVTNTLKKSASLTLTYEIVSTAK